MGEVIGPRRRGLRGAVKIASGAAGIAIATTEGLWLNERIKGHVIDEKDEDLGRLIWGLSLRKKLVQSKTLNAVIFADTDPASEQRYIRNRTTFEQLKILTRWIKVPGPTAGQDPKELYDRIRDDEEVNNMMKMVFNDIANTIDIDYLQCIQFHNSMHGTGISLNTFIAEKIIPSVFKGDYYKLMIAINADITRAPSKLDYLKSTTWALEKFKETLSKGELDAIIIIDNTVVSAVKSTWIGEGSKEVLKKAWHDFIKTEDMYQEGIARFYKSIAKLAKLDPHECNDLIVQASAPITLVPIWGMLIEKEERELRSSSSPWDYKNLKNVTRGGYIIPGYIPGDLLQRIDFRAISEELAISTLAPLDPSTVRNLIIVLGEEDKRLWEGKGISMYYLLEENFTSIGYDGPLDILTLPRERGIWIFAIVNDVSILRAKFELRPW